jgi:uncharacterized SAM-binding protein YcdF (DUF218 family)
MFFALSKILYLFIKPIVWLVFYIGKALWTKNDIRRRKILRGCLWFVILFTNPFLSNRIFHAWEWPAVAMTSVQDTFDVGIVLGGYSDFGGYNYQDRLNFNPAVNRLADAIVLYKKGHLKKILLSGGDGKLFGEKISEAVATRQFLLDLGIKNEDILTEEKSRNTRENALFTKDLLEKQGIANAKCLLLTSAFHMKRSKGCFDKVGLNTTAFPAHFFAARLEAGAETYIVPDKWAFVKWEAFIKEWIGYIVYWVQGYI